MMRGAAISAGRALRRAGAAYLIAALTLSGGGAPFLTLTVSASCENLCSVRDCPMHHPGRAGVRHDGSSRAECQLSQTVPASAAVRAALPPAVLTTGVANDVPAASWRLVRPDVLPGAAAAPVPDAPPPRAV
jgi:hypothetical protein